MIYEITTVQLIQILNISRIFVEREELAGILWRCLLHTPNRIQLITKLRDKNVISRGNESLQKYGIMTTLVMGNNSRIKFRHLSTHHGSEEPCCVPFGRAVIRRSGEDPTLLAIGNIGPQASRAAAVELAVGLSVEIVIPNCLLHQTARQSVIQNLTLGGQLLLVLGDVILRIC